MRSQVERHGKNRIAVVGATAADCRDTIVEGESGILAISPPWNRPKYRPSKRRLEWPNGAIATLYSAEEPDRLRGPQHDAAWGDELAAWRYAETYDQLMFGLRFGDNPQAVFTTTPRPTPIMLDLFRRADIHDGVVITKGDTYQNKANLAKAFIRNIVARYEGTRLGAQELYAELLTDVPGALWQREKLDALRVVQVPDMYRVVVAIDPAVSSNENSAETGIVVVARGANGHGYILGDYSGTYKPLEWAREAVTAYHRHHADAIIGEVNNGGDLIEANIRSLEGAGYLPYTGVRATRGKFTRAEPISSLYDQGRFHHQGMFGKLEDQMCTWVQGEKSPDRLDALVWGATYLFDEYSGEYNPFDLMDNDAEIDPLSRAPDRAA